MLELIVAKQFRRDLIRAHDVISNQQPYVNPNAARRLFKHVDTTIDQIRDFPYVSQVAYSDSAHQLRCRRVSGTNFRIIYTIVGNEIIILSLIGKGYDFSRQ